MSKENKTVKIASGRQVRKGNFVTNLGVVCIVIGFHATGALVVREAGQLGSFLANPGICF